MSKVTNTISNNNGIIILCSVVIVEGYLRKFWVANKRENILYFYKMWKQSLTKVPNVILYMYKPYTFSTKAQKKWEKNKNTKHRMMVCGSFSVIVIRIIFYLMLLTIKYNHIVFFLSVLLTKSVVFVFDAKAVANRIHFKLEQISRIKYLPWSIMLHTYIQINKMFFIWQ